MDNAKLSRKQTAIVDIAISTANHCDAIYGTIAYQYGLKDDIQLLAELRGIIEYNQKRSFLNQFPGMSFSSSMLQNIAFNHTNIYRLYR